MIDDHDLKIKYMISFYERAEVPRCFEIFIEDHFDPQKLFHYFYKIQYTGLMDIKHEKLKENNGYCCFY